VLIKINEWMKPNRNLAQPHRGVVKDNADPLKLGRLKIEISNLLVGTTADLPWVYPQNPYGLGGASTSSGFSVPEINSELVVVFPFKNIYAPVYTGYWQNTTNHQSVFDTNYPESYGFRDSKGNIFHVDKTAGTTKYTHHTGSYIEILNNGDININSSAAINTTSVGDTKCVVGGDMKFEVVGDFNVKTATVTITKNP